MENELQELATDEETTYKSDSFRFENFGGSMDEMRTSLHKTFGAYRLSSRGSDTNFHNPVDNNNPLLISHSSNGYMNTALFYRKTDQEKVHSFMEHFHATVKLHDSVGIIGWKDQ